MKILFYVIALAYILFPSASYAHETQRTRPGAIPSVLAMTHDDSDDSDDSDPDSGSSSEPQGDDFIKRPMGSLPVSVPASVEATGNSVQADDSLSSLEAAIADDDDVVPFKAIPNYNH